MILYWEKNGVWGLAQHYNLFNFEGWWQVVLDQFILVFKLLFLVEPILIAVKVFNGSLTPFEFGN